MHELSVAMSIIDISTDHAVQAGLKEVSKVEIEIGTLAGIEIEALLVSLKMASHNTINEKAEFEIITIQAKAKCNICKTVFDIENHFDPCIICSSYEKKIIQGQELRVRAIVGD